MDNVSQLDENSSTCTSSLFMTSPDDEVQEVMLTERICFDKANSKELASWKEHDVFEEVNFNGQKCVFTRWICTMKNTAFCFTQFCMFSSLFVTSVINNYGCR